MRPVEKRRRKNCYYFNEIIILWYTSDTTSDIYNEVKHYLQVASVACNRVNEYFFIVQKKNNYHTFLYYPFLSLKKVLSRTHNHIKIHLTTFFGGKRMFLKPLFLGLTLFHCCIGTFGKVHKFGIQNEKHDTFVAGMSKTYRITNTRNQNIINFEIGAAVLSNGQKNSRFKLQTLLFLFYSK